jgi:hypothetical protein
MTETFFGEGLREADSPQPDRVSINPDGQIGIQAGYDEWIGAQAEPYIVGDEHNLYEWR